MTLEDTGRLSVALASIDGKPLGESERMLLCAVGETRALNESEEVFETFDGADAPRDWAAGAFTGAKGLSWNYVHARRASIGAGPALALQGSGKGSLSAKMLTGVQSLRFQFKALEAGEARLEVLVDGKVKHVSEREDIKETDEVRDVRAFNISPVRPGAEVTIRTSADCAVPVAVDNLQLKPGPIPGLGNQLVMRPPVGDVSFQSPVKAVYTLNLSGQRKATAEAENGTTFRLDNTHETPWFEIVR